MKNLHAIMMELSINMPANSNYDNSFYCVEHLNCFSWVRSIFPSLWQTQSRRVHEKAVLYYIDATPAGLWLSRCMSNLVHVHVQIFDFKLIDVQDHEGCWIRLRLVFKDTHDVQEQIKNNAAFKTATTSKWMQGSRLKTFLTKSLFSFDWVNDANSLLRAVLLVQLCLWKSKLESKQGPIVLFVNQRLWSDELKAYAQKWNVQPVMVEHMSWPWRQILTRIFGRNRLRAIYYRLKIWQAKQNESKAMPNVTQPAHLMVDYNGQLNLDAPQMYSDVFFWQQSDLMAGDIVINFKIPKAPLDEHKNDQVQSHGMKAIVTNPKASVINTVDVFNFWPNSKKHVPEDLVQHFQEPKKGQWFKKRFEDYYEEFEYWQAFFKHTAAKVYVSWYRFDQQHCVIADAMQNLGGVTAIYQRSFEEAPLLESITDTDIIFGFSKYNAAIDQKVGSIIPYYVITGYNGDHRFALLKPQGAEIRAHLHAAGARHIVGYLDENSNDSSRWHTGHEYMRQAYEFWLEKVLRHKEFGLVLKPKVPWSLRRRLGNVAKLLEQAEATGRCYVIDQGKGFGTYPPALAAAASDIIVHGYMTAGTAGIECALTGTPTLMFDGEKWPDSIFYRLGDKVAFNDWNHLWSMCLTHWQKPIPGFGQWNDMLGEFDPFRDGQAAKRMGTYLKWLMDGFKAGQSRHDILEQAARRYQQQWGKDKIQRINV